MTKYAFLAKLGNALSGLPAADVEERLAFYGEMIDDRIEEGLSEETAVAAVGSIEEIVNETLADIPLAKLVKERVKPKRALRGWEVALIVIGFPLWFPLVLFALVVLLSLYVVLWSIVLSLWAVDLSLAAGGIGGVVFAVVYAVQGFGFPALGSVGMGIASAGLSVLCFFVAVAVSKGTVIAGKKICIGIKRLFVGKEKRK